MILVTKQQHPVVDSCCFQAKHPHRQFTSLSPSIVLEAVNLRAVQSFIIITSSDNQVLKINSIFRLLTNSFYLPSHMCEAAAGVGISPLHHFCQVPLPAILTVH